MHGTLCNLANVAEVGFRHAISLAIRAVHCQGLTQQRLIQWIWYSWKFMQGEQLKTKFISCLVEEAGASFLT